MIGWGQIASEVVSYSLGARRSLRQKMIVEKNVWRLVQLFRVLLECTLETRAFLMLVD